MLAGGFEICAFGYCTGPEIIYDEVLQPIGHEIAEDASYVYNYYAEDPSLLARNFGIGAAIPLIIAANVVAPEVVVPIEITVGVAACGTSEPARPAQQDVAPPPPPPQAEASAPPPPVVTPALPQFGVNYYSDLYKYLSQLKQQTPDFSYHNPDSPVIEPSLSISQGAFELICYGAYNGKIDIAEGDKTLGSCDRWLIPGLSPMTSGNEIFYYDPAKGLTDTSKPEVAYVAAILGQSAPNGMTAPMNIEHKLLQAADDFGFAARIAFENQQSSSWAALQPALAAELKTFFERTSDACFAVDNEGQDLFNRMKMLLAERDSFGTIWSDIYTGSETKIVQERGWMVPLLAAGAVAQMLTDLSRSKLRALPNGSDLLEQATRAYYKARELCPTCLPDIYDVQVASCLRELDPDTMAQWDAPTLVAWQLLRIGQLLDSGSGISDGGTRDAGTSDVVDATDVLDAKVDLGGRGPSNPWAVGQNPDAGSQ